MAEQGELREPVRVPGFTIRRGVHRAGSALPVHWHETPTICYVLHGRFTEYARGRAVDCRPGAVHLVPAGESHWNRFPWGDARGLRVDVDPARWDDWPDVARLLADAALVRGGAAARLMDRVLASLDARDVASRLVAEGALLELLGELARGARDDSAATRAARLPAWLAEARDLVHDEGGTTLGLGALARRVGVHPVTLARGWRRAFGCSVGTSVRRARLERAARALTGTSLPLGEIAAASGYFDQSHFTHAFRRAMGMTPGQWRRSRRG